jgi:uncharacterized protein YcnI
MPSPLKTSRVAQPVIVALTLLVAVSSVARAHAVVYPKKSTPGAYEKYALRVPNEKDVATTRVEIRFPPQLRVVSFGEVTGWTLQELKDSSGRITGAVWTGNLAPERFVEFPFVAANPKDDGRLVWPAYQTYANGERVDWIGPEGSKRPASATTLDADSGGGGTTMLLAGAALVASLLSLGLALRPKTTA